MLNNSSTVRSSFGEGGVLFVAVLEKPDKERIRKIRISAAGRYLPAFSESRAQESLQLPNTALLIPLICNHAINLEPTETSNTNTSIAEALHRQIPPFTHSRPVKSEK
ncbi:hypothetical protein MHYP_G00288020 [Metynnis hypsauchen]